MMTGAEDQVIHRDVKEPWMLPCPEGSRRTRFAPAALSRLAASSPMGTRGLSFDPGARRRNRNDRRNRERRRTGGTRRSSAQLHDVAVPASGAGRLHDERVGPADVLVDLKRALRVGEALRAVHHQQAPRNSAISAADRISRSRKQLELSATHVPVRRERVRTFDADATSSPSFGSTITRSSPPPATMISSRAPGTTRRVKCSRDRRVSSNAAGDRPGADLRAGPGNGPAEHGRDEAAPRQRLGRPRGRRASGTGRTRPIRCPDGRGDGAGLAQRGLDRADLRDGATVTGGSRSLTIWAARVGQGTGRICSSPAGRGRRRRDPHRPGRRPPPWTRRTADAPPRRSSTANRG